MNLTVYDQFEQNTDLWHLARLGLPTASCFKVVMAAKGPASVTRGNYINELVAELKYGEPCAQYKYRNAYMDRGHEWEPEALEAYVEQADCSVGLVQKVGFIRNNELNIGCSPDGLVGELGGVEIKTLAPWLMIRHVRARSIPPEHMTQLQGSMLVTGRQWWDLVMYTRGEIDIQRVGRDAGLIDEIKRFLQPFQGELERAVLEATQERHTWRALRDLRDRQFSERLAEELEDRDVLSKLDQVAEDLTTPPVSAIREALEKSLARERFLEDSE